MATTLTDVHVIALAHVMDMHGNTFAVDVGAGAHGSQPRRRRSDW